MSHDLVLQTKIGREETLEKFLHTIGKKGTIKDPCAVRLRRVNREEFEARWAQKQEPFKSMRIGSSRD